jgi:hypothetical protein
VFIMATVPLTTGARLLGIHPKTLRHWLTMAHLPLAPHPTDARMRGVAEADLLEVATQHGRPLPALSAFAALQRDATSSFTEEQAMPLPAHGGELAHRTASLAAPAASLADVLGQLAQLHTQLATLQHQIVELALDLLPEQTGCSEHRLPPFDGRLLQTLASLQVPQQTDVAGALAPSPAPECRLLPVEVRARSRVTALIEYDAHGQYVAVCPRQGVLSLVPDSSAWFDWLAQLASFRFVGPAGRFSACRASEKGQYTRCWAARRWFHGHDFWH